MATAGIPRAMHYLLFPTIAFQARCDHPAFGGHRAMMTGTSQVHHVVSGEWWAIQGSASGADDNSVQTPGTDKASVVREAGMRRVTGVETQKTDVAIGRRRRLSAGIWSTPIVDGWF